MKFIDVLNQKNIIAYDKKPKTTDWVGIIIHHTDIGGRKNPDEAMWKKLYSGITGWLTAQDSNYLSAHFHVGRHGECTMLVDPRTHIAYHAGKSSWFHPKLRKQVDGWNQYAIGIEILGDGNLVAYSDLQYAKVAELCTALMADFPTIDPRCLTGHENIAPGRKFDPGAMFNWRRFFSLLKF